ncbi:hypothetical protein HK098_003507 [Nowakowskiella sp. JEL0407]|nr:hypothetical protein HK098_003507 [Nowakowskiella sp. JEL0407]
MNIQETLPEVSVPDPAPAAKNPVKNEKKRKASDLSEASASSSLKINGSQQLSHHSILYSLSVSRVNLVKEIFNKSDFDLFFDIFPSARPTSARKKQKVGFRGKTVLALVSKLKKNFDSLDLKKTLNRYCPSPSNLNKYRSPVVQPMRFRTRTCQILSFLKSIIKQLIPFEFFGSENNQSIIMDKVKDYLNLTRYETISLDFLMRGVKISECSWVAPPKSNTTHIPTSDTLKRTQLISEFLYWMFETLIPTMIKSHFYVTESNSYRNKLFYFLHSLWESMKSRYLVNLETLFARVDVLTDQKNEDGEFWRGGTRCISKVLRYSCLRLVPKEYGFRPIVNLGKRYSWNLNTDRKLQQPQISCNTILQNCYTVLKYEKANHPDYLQNCFLSFDEIHKALRDFKNSLSKDNLKDE